MGPSFKAKFAELCTCGSREQCTGLIKKMQTHKMPLLPLSKLTLKMKLYFFIPPWTRMKNYPKYIG